MDGNPHSLCPATLIAWFKVPVILYFIYYFIRKHATADATAATAAADAGADAVDAAADAEAAADAVGKRRRHLLGLQTCTVTRCCIQFVL